MSAPRGNDKLSFIRAIRRLQGQIFAPCKICIPHIPVGYAEGRATQEQLPSSIL